MKITDEIRANDGKPSEEDYKRQRANLNHYRHEQEKQARSADPENLLAHIYQQWSQKKEITEAHFEMKGSELTLYGEKALSALNDSTYWNKIDKITFCCISLSSIEQYQTQLQHFSLLIKFEFNDNRISSLR